MENTIGVATLVKDDKKQSPWRHQRKEFTPGVIERREEYRATIIDTNVSLRQNIERSWKNYLYY